MDFTKNDIKPLDRIISLLLLKPNIDIGTLYEEKIIVDESNGLEIDLINTPQNTYERYIKILKNRNLCEVGQTKEGKYALKTDLTYDFQKSGGFKKLYKELNKKSIDLYRAIPIFLTIAFGISTFYFAKKNYDLKIKESRVTELEIEIDSLKKMNEKLRTEIKIWSTKTELKTTLE
ncbi:hypothetical protein [Arenibacter algicola]|uniref:Uncharacterized protein n=1 Tax=Arenibacter algicola TaxID=616991 RepID=A0A221UVP3_9FLAO|nr:hypothetical protein [Arenibacter algicola]ASO05415.1 hypothetical protein AREALGSMS7_01953 [Arenibacter algicola]|tara:strand:+ start:185 stop:712 length:528 start_codon:yes stop_codon:yes gene_type:complete